MEGEEQWVRRPTQTTLSSTDGTLTSLVLILACFALQAQIGLLLYPSSRDILVYPLIIPNPMRFSVILHILPRIPFYTIYSFRLFYIMTHPTRQLVKTNSA